MLLEFQLVVANILEQFNLQCTIEMIFSGNIWNTKMLCCLSKVKSLGMMGEGITLLYGVTGWSPEGMLWRGWE